MKERTEPESCNSVFASLAAIGSVLAASTCCLSTIPFVAAAGTAAGADFLVRAKPYLLAAAVALLAHGFYQAWRARTCGRKTGPVSTILLVASTVFVLLSTVFPQVMANLAADILAR